LIGSAKGEKIFLLKLPLYLNGFPVKFRTVHFPIKVCFTMPINKAQGIDFNLLLYRYGK
jgi:hypothetical protein